MSQINVDTIKNKTGSGAPNFPNGATITGVTTSTSFAGALTGTADLAEGLTGTPNITINNITGVAATFTGAVAIGGTLIYEDVTNVDSVGVITARTNIFLGDSLKHLGDDNTLISFPSNDTITVHTNGSERLRIDSTGRVGLSTVSPAGTLHVQGNQVGAIVAMPANSVDCSAGNYFTKTITGATTFTFDSVPANVEYSFTLEVTLNGSNAITWPASVKWPADTAPTITDGKTQLFVFITDDGGTRWRGSSLVDYTN